MEASGFSEMLLRTWRHIPDGIKLNVHLCGYLKFRYVVLWRPMAQPCSHLLVETN